MASFKEAQDTLHRAQDEEITRRAIRVSNLLQDSEKYTSQEKKYFEKQFCTEDGLIPDGTTAFEHWLKNWVWLYEPRPTPREIPFMQWDEVFPNHKGADYQKRMFNEIMSAIKNGHDLRVEKSRDMGLTWTVLIAFTYLWQFHGMTFLVGSRKAEEVDKMGDLDTLLPKVRFMLEKQPKWLLPKGFEMDKHARFMNIENPQSKGAITGESNNANFGTGGRKNAAFLDEFAKWEYTDSQAWTSVANTTPCRIAASTPFFKNNRFYVLLKEPIKNITQHWTDHPLKGAGLHDGIQGEKTSDFYEKQKTRLRPDEIAQELDISYAGTQQSSVFFDELSLLRQERRLTKVPYTPDLPIIWALDPGMGDTWANGFYQILGYAEEIRWFDYYENQNEKIGHYLDWVKSPDRAWNKLHQDIPPGGDNYTPRWRDIQIVPDPNQSTNRELTSAKSLKTQLHEAGFKKVFIRKIGKMEALSEAKRIFKNLLIDSGEENERMKIALDRLQGYHYKYNENTQEYAKEPVHDVNCLEGKTNIRTLSGWKLIQDIVAGEYVWGYSLKERRLIPTVCSWAGKTGKKRVIEIGLDNGKSIKCTRDHRFLMRDETYRYAQDLKKGDSLMPFYEFDSSGYIQINLNDGSLAIEHKFVYERLRGSMMTNSHIDHKNDDHYDNRIENLQELTKEEHCSKTFIGKKNRDRKKIDQTDYSREIYSNSHLFQDCQFCEEEYWGSYKSSFCSKKCRLAYNRVRHSRTARQLRNESFKEQSRVNNRNFELRRKHPCLDCEKIVSRKAQRCTVCAAKKRNHKVRFVNFLDQEVDVYDLTVPETSNFVAEGVVVHNSHCADQFKYLANYIKNPEKMERELRKQKDRRDRAMMPRKVYDTGMTGA